MRPRSSGRRCHFVAACASPRRLGRGRLRIRRRARGPRRVRDARRSSPRRPSSPTSSATSAATGSPSSSIIPPGAGPEDYEPKPEDARKLADADLIVSNGVGLDDFLDKLIKAAGEGAATRLVLGDGIPTITVDGEANPHFWLDPSLVADHYVPAIAAELMRARSGRGGRPTPRTAPPTRRRSRRWTRRTRPSSRRSRRRTASS